MDVNALREIYNQYEKNASAGTLIEDGTMDPAIRIRINIMIMEHEKLEKTLINDVYKKIKEIAIATENCEDDDSFIKVSNPIYLDAKGKHIGHSEKLFTSLVLMGVNDIIVKRFS